MNMGKMEIRFILLLQRTCLLQNERFFRCLYAFENVKGGKYISLALFYRAGIYYSFGD